MLSSSESNPKVLIIYSHETEEHMDRVLSLSDRLRTDGIDCIIDQYETSPPEGWPRWSDNQIEESNFILIVCTKTYEERFKSIEEQGKGKGVKWEGLIILQRFYESEANNRKFIPIIFSPNDQSHIPTILRGTNFYNVDTNDGYEALYRHITDQPNVIKPRIGNIKSMPPRSRKQEFNEVKITELNSRFKEVHKAAHISSSSFYVQMQISDLIGEYLRLKGLEVDEIPADRDITIEDILPRLSNRQLQELPKLIREARSYAFDKKYADQKPDFRGPDGHWKNEIRNILATLGATEFNKRHIIDVGIGSGFEGVDLLDSVQHLTAVDIAKKSLNNARQRLPEAKLVINEAENLMDIQTNSQDIYISLRTYQSAYFDVAGAIREAYRVIRQGGLIIISVVNGYVGPGGDLILGELFPKSNIVDWNRPYEVIDQIRRKMTFLRFEGIGIRTGFAEIYVYGRKAR
jgi:SAM-dependent methyltransferase